MFTRISSAFLMLCALGACDRQGQSVAADAPGVECRTDGAQTLRPICKLDRSDAVLTVRHPDGGFRRLRILSGGKGLESADGAERVKLTIISDNAVDVAVSDDVYRLPATIMAR